MGVFEFVIALLLGGAALTALSRRIGLPYPALMALAGAGLALIPGTPTLELDPELALTLFVAPVLLDAAFDSSLRDLRANWRPIAGLAIGAVVLTVVAVALVVRLLVPEMPWAVAIALGAILAPPDAAAATAVLKQLRPPHRLLVVLEGESLFNDASALLIYRLAVGVALAGVLSPGQAIPLLLFVTIGSIGLGLVLSRALLFVLTRIEDVPIVVIVQFCATFAVWLLAERLHLSGILTMVVFAMTAARQAPRVTPARIRVPSYAVWESAVFVLNVLAFVLVGLQLRAILERIDRPTLLSYASVAGAVFLATVIARIVYVAAAAKFRPGADGLSTRAAGLVAWCGMRGIVTLAAALALPTASAEGGPFPFRDLIVFVAFSVVLGTLVVQGMTLRPLIKWLRLEDDGTVDREVRLARIETLGAALAAMTSLPPDDISDVLQRRYRLMLSRAQGEIVGAAEPPWAPADERRDLDEEIIRTATSAEREKLHSLRTDGTIGDAAFQRIEQELDLEELYLKQIAGRATD